MTPNYDLAATKALEVLRDNNIRTAPIDPFPILKNWPGVIMMSFEEISNEIDINRDNIIHSCKHSPDAVTAVHVDGKELHYIVAYNRYLSAGILQKSLARELGHVVLCHDGSLPDDIRTAEAKCFANHLLCPRPLIHSIQTSGLKITKNVLSSITDFYDDCISCMRKIPETHTPKELNREVRDMFMHYITNYFEYRLIIMHRDETELVDFGEFMDGYEE